MFHHNPPPPGQGHDYGTNPNPFADLPYDNFESFSDCWNPEYAAAFLINELEKDGFDSDVARQLTAVAALLKKRWHQRISINRDILPELSRLLFANKLDSHVSIRMSRDMGNVSGAAHLSRDKSSVVIEINATLDAHGARFFELLAVIIHQMVHAYFFLMCGGDELNACANAHRGGKPFAVVIDRMRALFSDHFQRAGLPQLPLRDDHKMAWPPLLPAHGMFSHHTSGGSTPSPRGGTTSFAQGSDATDFLMDWYNKACKPLLKLSNCARTNVIYVVHQGELRGIPRNIAGPAEHFVELLWNDKAIMLTWNHLQHTSLRRSFENGNRWLQLPEVAEVLFFALYNHVVNNGSQNSASPDKFFRDNIPNNGQHWMLVVKSYKLGLVVDHRQLCMDAYRYLDKALGKHWALSAQGTQIVLEIYEPEQLDLELRTVLYTDRHVIPAEMLRKLVINGLHSEMPEMFRMWSGSPDNTLECNPAFKRLERENTYFRIDITEARSLQAIVNESASKEDAFWYKHLSKSRVHIEAQLRAFEAQAPNRGQHCYPSRVPTPQSPMFPSRTSSPRFAGRPPPPPPPRPTATQHYGPAALPSPPMTSTLSSQFGVGCSDIATASDRGPRAGPPDGNGSGSGNANGRREHDQWCSDDGSWQCEWTDGGFRARHVGGLAVALDRRGWRITNC